MSPTLPFGLRQVAATQALLLSLAGMSACGAAPTAAAAPEEPSVSPAAQAAPGATRYLATGGGRIAYDDVGTGPVVLCLPSLGDLRAEYRLLTPHLVAAGYRVVTMDLRGLGESSTGWADYSVVGVGADIRALAHHLQAGPVTVIGSSMAGGAAVVAAADEPETVSRIVLLDAFVRDHGPAWQSRAIASVFSGFWGAGLWCTFYRSLYPTAQPADFERYVAALRANLDDGARLAAVREMLAAPKAAAEQRLAKVRVPVLAIMGTLDPDFKDPAAEGQFQVEHLGAELRMIEGAGHYPHAEMPAVTAPIITEFLDRGRTEATRGT